MGWYKFFKYKLMRLFGIKPKLNEIVYNLKEKQAEQKGYVPEPTPITTKCGYHSCKKKLVGLSYKCKYCGGRYCGKHRLPEDHDCDDPKLPKEMRLGSGINKKLSENRFSEAIKESN